MATNFTAEQQQAIDHVDGPCVLAAAAGSGKTATVAARVNALIAKGVNPAAVFVTTFTKAAAEEMEARIGVEDIGFCGTFHSFGYKVLRRMDPIFSFSRKRGEGSVMGVAEPKAMIAAIIEYGSDFNKLGAGLCNPETFNMDPKLAHTYLSRISLLKNQLVTPEAYMRRSDSDPGLAELYEIYEERKANGWRMKGQMPVRMSHPVYDFDDMLIKSFYYLKSDAGAKFLSEIHGDYKYFIVDESQDCNLAQYSLLKLIAKSGNVMLVGDDDQSIYAFRGAVPEHFIAGAKDAQVINLSTNFRSRAAIVNAAAKLIAHNSERLPKTMTPHKG